MSIKPLLTQANAEDEMCEQEEFDAEELEAPRLNRSKSKSRRRSWKNAASPCSRRKMMCLFSFRPSVTSDLTLPVNQKGIAEQVAELRCRCEELLEKQRRLEDDYQDIRMRIEDLMKLKQKLEGTIDEVGIF